MKNHRPDVIICNPGTHPEMTHIAAALAAEVSVMYATSSSFATESRLMRLVDNVRDLLPATSDLVSRRRLPAGIQPHQVVHSAVLFEAIFQIAKRVSPKHALTMMKLRNRVFESQIGRYIRAMRPKLLIGQYTASLGPFKSAPSGTLRVLNYPTAHHRWLRNRFDQEAILNPRWSSLLAGAELTPDELLLLDQEINLADYVIVPSSFAARTFRESGVSASKLIVLPLGCDPQPLCEVESRASHDDQIRVLYAGRVTQRKGIGYLVEAIQMLPQARLTIIGECPPQAADMLRNYERVQLTPSMARDRLLIQMREMDVLVLPSLADGFGLVALEAMSVGCPVLLSKETFADDIIDDGVNGFLLDRTDPVGISSRLLAIKDLLSSSSLRREAMSTASMYSWDRYRNEVRDICTGFLTTLGESYR